MISCMLFGWFRYLSIHTSHWCQFCGERFCFVLNNARPLLPLETAFFETARAGKGILSLHLSSAKSTHFTVPVIAIFTKFDDLITQVYDMDQDEDVNRQIAEEQVEKNFRTPLYGYAFPPLADVCFEGKCLLILCRIVDQTAQHSPMQICIFPKQVNIRTRWKFSSRRRHPHWMLPLSRCCLFQCSKII